MDLFLGSRNNSVRQLENKLKSLDLYAGAIDGVFGGGVESAVKEFQKAHGLYPDGMVGPETWAVLFPDAPQPVSPLEKRPLAERCLALSGAFETTSGFPECFSGLAGDFDGEGISFGVLQWNIGQGTLQPLFSSMLEKHPQTMERVFHDKLDDFTHVLSLPLERQLQWWNSIQSPKTGEIFEPWKGYLLTLGRTDPFQQIQVSHSEKIYSSAATLVHDYQLTSERGMALMFDICVQNGWIEPETRGLILSDFSAIPKAASHQERELEKMQSIANRIADSSRPEYVEDVRIRKMTIADGVGCVHGMFYDLLSQYDIGLVNIGTA